MERIQSKNKDFCWNTVTKDIRPENLNIFKTQGKLKIEECRNHCNPFLTNGTVAKNI